MKKQKLVSQLNCKIVMALKQLGILLLVIASSKYFDLNCALGCCGC